MITVRVFPTLSLAIFDVHVCCIILSRFWISDILDGFRRGEQYSSPRLPKSILRPQGVSGSKKEVRIILKISWSRAGCKKPHQKILFLAQVMNFLNQAHNTSII